MNGEYYIVKVFELGEDRARLLYRCYSPRSAVECSVSLTPGEVSTLLGGEGAALLGAVAGGGGGGKEAALAALHGRIIDSLGFEDRLLGAAVDTQVGRAAVTRAGQRRV